jgi:hypothetical protein
MNTHRFATLLCLLCLLCLACGGMMGVFIPDLPVALPPEGVRVFVGLEEQGQTRVSGISESMSHAAVRQHFLAQLEAGGWAVQEEEIDASTVLNGQRGRERLVITVTGPEEPPAEFEVRWMP